MCVCVSLHLLIHPSFQPGKDAEPLLCLYLALGSINDGRATAPWLCMLIVLLPITTSAHLRRTRWRKAAGGREGDKSRRISEWKKTMTAKRWEQNRLKRPQKTHNQRQMEAFILSCGEEYEKYEEKEVTATCEAGRWRREMKGESRCGSKKKRQRHWEMETDGARRGKRERWSGKRRWGVHTSRDEDTRIEGWESRGE